MTLNEAMPLASEFFRLTGKSLFELVSAIWLMTGECIPDPQKIDQWLDTPNGVSTRDWLCMKHGTRAVEIMDTLLNDETKE